MSAIAKKFARRPSPPSPHKPVLLHPAADEAPAGLPILAASIDVDNSHVIGIAGSDRPISDERAQELLKGKLNKQNLLDRTREVLDEAEVALNEDALEAIISDIKQANASYGDAFDNLLDTGRCLNRIQRIIGVGGYKALVNSGVVLINETTASKLRRIASAIDTRRIPADLHDYIPRNTSGAYLLSNLPRDRTREFMCALVGQGLLPDAPVRTLEEAVKRLKNGNATSAASDTEKVLLHELALKEATLARQKSELEKTRDEVESLRARIEAIRNAAQGTDAVLTAASDS